MVAIDSGAFFVLGETPLGRCFIPINLPAAHAFAAAGFVFDETTNILRRISQKEADFMREIFLLPNPPNQLGDTAFAAAEFVTLFSEKGGSGIIRQISAQSLGTVEIDQRPLFLDPKGKRP